METEPDVFPTYIMFQRNKEGDIIEIVGPIFEPEFENCKLQFFDDSLEIQTMDETMFKHIYPAEYLDHFAINWTDYISGHLEAAEIPFNFEIQELVGEDGEEHEVILSFNNFFILKDPDKDEIEIYFHVTFPIWWAAELARTLATYINPEFEFNIGPLYYRTIDGVSAFGEEAWLNWQKDKLYHEYSKS